MILNYISDVHLSFTLYLIINRFSDFQRSLGVARNILADRLRNLVEEDILRIQPASDGTSYHEYVLTAKGDRLFPVVVALRQWGEQYLFRQGELHSQLLDKATGKTVEKMALRDANGEALNADQTTVKKSCDHPV